MKWLTWGRAGVVLLVVASIGILSIPIVALTGLQSSSGHHGQIYRKSGNEKGSRALRAVTSALGHTLSSGSFDVTYEFGRASSTGSPVSFLLTGNAIVRLDPVEESIYAGGGADTSLRVSGTTAYVALGRGIPTTAPCPCPPSSQTMQSYNSSWTPYTLMQLYILVVGYLGIHMGSLAMMDIASPSGMLDLANQEITSSTVIGHKVVDGIQTTEYAITVNPSDLLDMSGITQAEKQVAQVSFCLANQPQVPAHVYVDSNGYIREVSDKMSNSSGGQYHSYIYLSNFGTNQTVVMPQVAGGPSGNLLPQPGTGSLVPPIPSSSSTQPPQLTPIQTHELACVTKYYGSAAANELHNIIAHYNG